MSRSKRFLGGAMWGYANQALVMVTGLWLTPFLLHHLGQSDYGLWLTALPILNYLMLADFGVIALLPRTVAYATGRSGGKTDSPELPATLGQTAVVVLFQTPVVMLAAGLTWALLPAEWSGLRGPLGMTMGVFALSFPLRMFPAALEGLQEQVYLGRANMAAWTVGTLVNVALIFAGFRLYAVALGWLIMLVGASLGCFYRIWTKHREILPSRLPRLSKAELWTQLGSGFWISVIQLAQTLMAGTDVLVIGKILGPAMVVPYVCTAKLANVLANQPQMVMQMAMPGLSEMKTGESRERLYRVAVALSQGMLLMTGLLFCVITVINKPFVSWWVGPKLYGGVGLTSLILLQMLLRHWNMTFGYTAFCFGYEKRLAIASLADGLITVCAMRLLVGHFSYAGVVIGSLIGVTVANLPTTLTSVARELHLPVSRMALPFWPWFWRFALLGGGCMILARNWVPGMPFQAAGIAIAISAVYILVMLRPILASPLGPYCRRVLDEVRAIFVKPVNAVAGVEKVGP